MGKGAEKRCTTCGETMPKTAFHRRALSRDGLAASCKECNNGKGRQCRVDFPDEVREKEARWRDANRDRLRESYARWGARHPDLKKQRARDDYLKNKGAYKERARAQRERDPERAARASKAARDRAQAGSLASATKARQQWTGAEMEIATERDAEGGYVRTAREVALTLGRSLYSVRTIRHRCMSNPKYQRVIGAQD